MYLQSYQLFTILEEKKIFLYELHPSIEVPVNRNTIYLLLTVQYLNKKLSLKHSYQILAIIFYTVPFSYCVQHFVANCLDYRWITRFSRTSCMLSNG